MCNIASQWQKGASKIIPILLASILLAGCINHAPAQRYYFKPGVKPSLFTGELDGLSGDINISIDGIKVMEGKFPRFSESLKLDGDYKGQKIHANCKMMYCTNSISCFVYVNQQPAAFLEFGKP
jgi:hypothetical protein